MAGKKDLTPEEIISRERLSELKENKGVKKAKRVDRKYSYGGIASGMRRFNRGGKV